MLNKIVTIMSYVGSVFVAAMALMTGLDIGGRYVFNLPLRGVVDLTEVTLAMVVACGLVITTAEDNHIVVDSIYEKLRPFGKKILLVFATILSAFGFAIFSWQGGIGVMDAIRSRTATLMLEIPLFPFKFILALGFLLSLIFTIHRLVRLLFTKKS